MRKIIKILFYSKQTPIFGFSIIFVFLLVLYLVIMPIAASSWPNTPLKNISLVLIFLFTVIWPIYCIALSIYFLKRKKYKKQAIIGLILNVSWLLLIVVGGFLGAGV